MKNTHPIPRFLPVLLLCLFTWALPAQSVTFTETDRQTYLANRQDSTTWDREMFAGDTDFLEELKGYGPLPNGPYPVPHYDLLGDKGFGGALSIVDTFHSPRLPGKLVAHYSYGLGNFPVDSLRADEDYTVFFSLITLTDTLQASGYPVAASIVSSRNNPDVVAQGTVENTTSEVSFVAFVTAEGRRYALVNMRLFDLAYGNTVIVVPHHDGTFRSLQVHAEPTGQETVIPYLEREVLTLPAVQGILNERGALMYKL